MKMKFEGISWTDKMGRLEQRDVTVPLSSILNWVDERYRPGGVMGQFERDDWHTYYNEETKAVHVRYVRRTIDDTPLPEGVLPGPRE